MSASDEVEFELPNRGDDRPGLDEVDDLIVDDDVVEPTTSRRGRATRTTTTTPTTRPRTTST